MWPISRIAIFNATPLLSSKAELEKANGSLILYMQTGQFIGMAIAAWLLLKYAFIVSLFFVCFVYAFSLCFFYYASRGLLNRSPEQTISPDSKINSDSSFANSTTNANDIIREILRFSPVFLVSNFDYVAMGIFNLLLVAIVADIFGGSAFWLAALDASYTVGAIIGGYVIARGKKKTVKPREILFTQVVFMAFFLFLYFVTDQTIYIIFFLATVLGLYTSYAVVFWRTCLQTQLPKHSMGRLAGVRQVVSSIQVGIVVMLISFAHEYSYLFAVIASFSVVFIQLIIIFIFFKRSNRMSYGEFNL